MMANVKETKEFLEAKLPGFKPDVALVVGSGLGGITQGVAKPVVISYTDIPHFPKPTVAGHAGQMIFGELAGKKLMVLSGRFHRYEGRSPAEIVFPIHMVDALGVKTLIVTNAAGGINPQYAKGALVLLRDHINLLGQNPLIGANDDRFGLRHPDMTDAYSGQLRYLALQEAERLGEELFEGVYAAVAGPSFETPAEIRYLRAIGADLVGMSTVPEAIVARQMGIEVLGISCVTNLAAGILNQAITHEEVLETGERVHAQFTALLRGIVPRIAEEMR